MRLDDSGEPPKKLRFNRFFVNISSIIIIRRSWTNFLDDEEDAPAPVDEAKSDKDEGDAVDENADELNEEEDADEVDALDDDVDELAYNSEEEIITKQKAAEFFENEAELSESEWGSEDENEQNLDELEKEAGDDDVLDEDEVQKELGKIHM